MYIKKVLVQSGLNAEAYNQEENLAESVRVLLLILLVWQTLMLYFCCNRITSIMAQDMVRSPYLLLMVNSSFFYIVMLESLSDSLNQEELQGICEVLKTDMF